MTRTHEKVGYSPKGKPSIYRSGDASEAPSAGDESVRAENAARGTEEVLRVLDGRWKMTILFHLFNAARPSPSPLGPPWTPSSKAGLCPLRFNAARPSPSPLGPPWFSELERSIPDVSQKMLIQQLRELEADGIVVRTVHPQVPPKVEYSLTEWGRELCPALDALLKWGAKRPKNLVPLSEET
ncbi:winged helix-turn-helix transcriptional regulator [Labilithrix luteola]|uniref:winged helix-turn-helix transcriptional regulator n=1 Tax=Labilithrix luteola TaxID=1391654 RepID=UPI0023DE1173|nr:helix-turn-helix domain-containing protein [Labilithrix luteola]